MTRKSSKADAPTATSHLMEPEEITTQRFSNVADLVDAIFDDDDSFAEEVKERLRARELVKRLQIMRIANGTSQSEIAKELGCSQSRVSKLENGFDAELTFGDVEAYARALGWSVHLQFTKPNETSLDRIKRFAFYIHHELQRMAELANQDQDIAKGVAQTFGEVLFNQVRLLQLAAEKLPVDPKTEEPYIHVDVQFREGSSNVGGEQDDDRSNTEPSLDSAIA
jgi:transcriptional regulator with XRE-family HTH domain